MPWELPDFRIEQPQLKKYWRNSLNSLEYNLYLNNTTKGTDVTKANWNHELKMYARPAKIINATAKNKQIIIPAKVRYAGPMISRPVKKIENNIIWKIRTFVETRLETYIEWMEFERGQEMWHHWAS